MEDVTPLSDAYILYIITAHLSTAGIHQTIMFLVALADMGETRRCRIKWDTGLEVRIPGIKHAQTHFVDRNLSFCPPFYISRELIFHGICLFRGAFFSSAIIYMSFYLPLVLSMHNSRNLKEF